MYVFNNRFCNNSLKDYARDPIHVSKTNERILCKHQLYKTFNQIIDISILRI